MIMTKKHIFIASIIFAIFILQACGTSSSKGPKIDKSKLVNMDVKIHRYEKALAEADTNNFLSDISKIQSEFPLFLGTNKYTKEQLEPLYEYVADTQIIALSNAVLKMYPDLDLQEKQLSDAFSRYHYFFPNKVIPKVYSYVSNLYYQEPIIFDDTVAIISLDVYLGDDFSAYRSLGIPYYKIRRMTEDYIVIDVMKAMYINELASRKNQRTLVDRMVSAGKLLYYLDAVLPEIPDSLKIGYTSKQMDWVTANKANVWAFLVDNEMFYSADYKTQTKLLQDGPFTTGFTNNSPPRLGIWLGWQIVRSYMDSNPNITLSAMLQNTDNQAIFNQSGYKP